MEAQLLIYQALAARSLVDRSGPDGAWSPRGRPLTPADVSPALGAGERDDEFTPGGSPGTVYWICGLSGAGKSTFARRLVPALRARGRHPVLLDGDALRVMLTGTAGYDVAARRWMGRCYAVLARLIAAEGIDVVCAAISPFADLRRQQRSDIARYCEVWIDAPLTVVRARDPKGLYGSGNVVRSEHVVGLDIPFEPPTAPDHVVVNVGTVLTVRAAARAVAASQADASQVVPDLCFTSSRSRARARSTRVQGGRGHGA